MSLRGFIGVSLLLLFACQEDPKGIGPSTISEEKISEGWHYSSPSGSISSVDGLYLEDGLYHLFYSGQPVGRKTAIWGHAVSTDLYSWKEWPKSKAQDITNPHGARSVVADPLNRSGLGTPSSPPILSYFSYTAAVSGVEGESRRLALAYSLDGGTTWKVDKDLQLKGLDSEPVTLAPRVFWWAGKELFVATIRHSDKNEIRILVSEDGWNWVQQGRFSLNGLLDPDSWDGAELFRLSESGGGSVWGLLINLLSNGPNGGSGTAYVIGEFDGREFRRAGEIQWLDYGPDNYSGAILRNETVSSPVYMGVMNNSLYHNRVPDGPLGTVLTLPRRLGISQNGDVVKSRPVEAPIAGTKWRRVDIQGNVFRLSRDTLAPVVLSLQPGANGFSLELGSKRNEKLSLYTTSGEEALLLDRMSSGRTSFEPEFGNKKHYIPIEGIPEDGLCEIEVYLDRNSVEVFLCGGRYVVSALVFPESPYQELIYRSKKD